MEASPISTAYIGHNDYLVFFSASYTQYVATKWLASLPSPDVKTICDKAHLGLLSMLIPDLKPVKWICTAASDAYKLYAVRDWLYVRNAINLAARHNGCGTFVWTRGNWLHDATIHLAHANGREVGYVIYGRTAQIDTDWTIKTPYGTTVRQTISARCSWT